MFNLPLSISTSGMKNKKLVNLKNEQMFLNTYTRLISTALDRYTFTGLPDTVSERVVLESLLFYGSVTFFTDHNALLALPSAPTGNGYNIYGDPLSAWVFSRNGQYNKEVHLHVNGGAAEILNKGFGNISGSKRGVLVWENKNRYPFINNVFYFASAISDTYRTLDTNRNWLKTPFIPVCEESLVPSVKDLFKKITDNNDIIPVSTGVQDISRFDLKQVMGVDDNVKSAIELIEWYEAQFRQLCGIDANTQVDKKGENLVADEIHVNDEITDKNAETVVDYINQQLELVNQVFGTNIKCECKTTTEEAAEQPVEKGENEDDV